MRVLCAICAGGLLDDDEEKNPVAMVPCGHTFHSKCLKSWIRKNPSKCAECRIGVRNLVQLKLNKGGNEPAKSNVKSVEVEANLMRYEKWCQMEKEITTLKAYRLDREIKLENLQSTVLLRENKVRLLQMRSTKYASEIEKLQSEIGELKSSSAFQKRKQQKLQKANSRLLQADKEKSDKITELKKVNALFNDELNTLRVTAHQFQLTSSTLQSEKEQLTEELQTRSKLSDARKHENETLQKANADLQKTHEQQVSKIEELNRITVLLDNEMERRQLELETKLRKDNQLKQRVFSDCIRRLNKCITPTESSKWKKITINETQDLNSLENSISKWETEIAKLHLMSSSRTKELANLRRSNLTLKVEITDLKSINSLLRENVSRLKANECSLAEIRQDLWTRQKENEDLRELITSFFHFQHSISNLEGTIRMLRDSNIELSRQTEHVRYLEKSVRQLIKQNDLLENSVLSSSVS